jgi:hypothetical protein
LPGASASPKRLADVRSAKPSLFFLTQAFFAEQPTPILPDLKLTPGDTFDVTAQDVCVPGYAKKVRAVPAWLKRQAYAEYGITEYKTSPWNSYVKDALERKLAPQAGMRRPIGSQDRPTRDSLRLDRSVQEIRLYEASRSNSPRDKDCTGNYGQ